MQSKVGRIPTKLEAPKTTNHRFFSTFRLWFPIHRILRHPDVPQQIMGEIPQVSVESIVLSRGFFSKTQESRGENFCVRGHGKEERETGRCGPELENVAAARVGAQAGFGHLARWKGIIGLITRT